MTAPSIYGVGLAFPFREGANGPETVSETDNVKASIAQILGTRMGERPFCVREGRPFGVRFTDMVFESVDTARDILPYEAREGLRIWEPRIVVDSVSLVESDDPRVILLSVDYRIRRTNRADNFVKPYRTTRALCL